MITNKSIVVFGGAGFIGSHALRFLAQQEGNTLTSVDISAPRIHLPGVNYITHDIRDLSTLKVEGQVDLIMNLAAVHTTPGHQTHEYYETNIRGATEVTAFARRHDVRDIIFTSSISVYGPGEDTKSEFTPVAPESAYGWSKWLAEGIHRAWLDEDTERSLVICRPAVIFGHTEGGNYVRMAKLLRKGGFVYPGRKDTIKGCFYVEDLISAIFFAYNHPDRYVLFNGTYPDRYTIEQIVQTMKDEAFPKARELMVPKWVVMVGAKMLRPFSAFGLGIHPDRVMKLIKSTDVVPGWLSAQNQAPSGQLPSAIKRWEKDSEGRFD